MEKNYTSGWKENDGKKVFYIHHRVRYADTDKMNMVYHGSYIPMLEAARVDTLRAIGWVYDEMEKAGVLLPVVDLQVKYFVPARYDQILRIETHVLESPISRLKFSFSIFHENTLLVTAQVCLAFVDASSSRPTRAPAALVQSLVSHSLIHE